MISKFIKYFKKPAILICDARCHKAWGVSNRPKVGQDPEDPDRFAFRADYELGLAPQDPGTREGGQPKPGVMGQRLNKWCARECERSVVLSMDPADPTPDDLTPDFSKRLPNIYEDRMAAVARMVSWPVYTARIAAHDPLRVPYDRGTA